MAVKLATPRLSVVLDEDDDEAIEVQTINADMVLAETTARKHNWGRIQDSAMKFQTFLAWAALRRKHLISGELSFEQFEQTCASISPVDVDDRGAPKVATDYAFPTLPDPGSG